MPDESTVPSETTPEIAAQEDVPKITAVVKTKNPNRVAQGKKLAAIRAEKRGLRELEARRDPPGEPACDGYQKISFYFTMFHPSLRYYLSHSFTGI